MVMLWSIYKLILLYYVYTLPYMPKYVFKLLARGSAHLGGDHFRRFCDTWKAALQEIIFQYFNVTRRKKREIYEYESFMTCGRNLLLTRLEKHSKNTQLDIGKHGFFDFWPRYIRGVSRFIPELQNSRKNTSDTTCLKCCHWFLNLRSYKTLLQEQSIL